jgi:hypothetical protein
MSWLCDTTELVPAGWLASLYAGYGVRGADVPSSGTDGPSALYPCLSLPADADVEVRGYVTRWPVAGTLDLAEDGSFVYTGSSDYFEFRLHADGPASAVDIGFGPGIVRVSLGVGVVSSVGAGATLGRTVAAGPLSGSAAGSIGAGATLARTAAGGVITGAVVSEIVAGAVLGRTRAGGSLLGQIGPITRQPRQLTLRSTRQRIGPLIPTTDDAA